jgi:hypothetical protein
MTNSPPDLGSKPGGPVSSAKIGVAKDSTAANLTQCCYNRHRVPHALQAAGVGAASL